MNLFDLTIQSSSCIVVPLMICWFAYLFDWLVGCLVGCLIGWLFGCLVGWLAGRSYLFFFDFVGCLAHMFACP